MKIVDRCDYLFHFNKCKRNYFKDLTISNDNLIHLDLTKTIYEIQLKTMLISEEYQNVLL